MALLFGTMAAYAIARLDFPGKKAIVGAALLIAMFPQIALVTPCSRSRPRWACSTPGSA